MQLMVILGILVAIGGVAFALQNNVPVTVTFLVWRFDSSLAMVLMLALGAIIVALVTTPAVIRSGWTIAHLRSEIDKLKAAGQTQPAARPVVLDTLPPSVPGPRL